MDLECIQKLNHKYLLKHSIDWSVCHYFQKNRRRDCYSGDVWCLMFLMNIFEHLIHIALWMARRFNSVNEWWADVRKGKINSGKVNSVNTHTHTHTGQRKLNNNWKYVSMIIQQKSSLWKTDPGSLTIIEKEFRFKEFWL